MKRMFIIFTLLLVGIIGIAASMISEALNPSSNMIFNVIIYVPLFIVGLFFLAIEVIKEYNFVKDKTKTND